MAKVLLINYDNGSHVPFFPLGLAYIAAAIDPEWKTFKGTSNPKAGKHWVGIWDQAITHDPPRELTRALDNVQYDVVGIGMCAGYYQLKKLIELSWAIRQSKNRKRFKFVVGGQIATPIPEFIQKITGCDFVVQGEAEETMRELVDRIDAKKPLDTIEGIWPNPRRKPPILHNLEPPAWQLFNMHVYRLMRLPTSRPSDFCFPVLAGRGCAYSCSFCYRMEKGLRLRDPRAVVGEMKLLHQAWGINHFILADELLMVSPSAVLGFCEAVKQADMFVKWDCSGRLNAKVCTPKILAEMKAAGCEYVNYGIEALDNEVLATMNKHLTTEEIEAGIRYTKEAGLTPGLNIMWGNPGDTFRSLQRAVRFLIQYDGCAELRTIRPVTPYPGCALYEQAVAEGTLAGPEDFYFSKHTNSDLAAVQWTGLSHEEFHKELGAANVELLDNFYMTRLDEARKEAIAFYSGRLPTFRGFRAV